jgi:hypothetical protein
VRDSIDKHPERIRAILMDDEMRKSFLKGAPKQESKAIKAFCASNAENMLKTKPKVSISTFSYTYSYVARDVSVNMMLVSVMVPSWIGLPPSETSTHGIRNRTV